MTHESISKRKIIKAASACVWRGDEVLVIQRGKALGYGFWSLPGGKLEPGEDALTAAHRELREEAGVTADLIHLVGVFPVVTPEVTYDIHCFTGLYLAGEARPGSDAMAVQWLHELRLPELKLATNTLEAVARARRLLGL
ncbi:MAG: NUDIX domain-containing protein [Hyphomicrobiales bacterium]